MFEGKTIGAILVMGGKGVRFGSDIPKQFHDLLGKKIYQHALETVQNSQLFDEIILVTHPDWMDIEPGEAILTAGGATRQESTYLGLLAFKTAPDIVLIHDAVRPFVTEKILKDNLAAAIRWGAVNTCVPSTDTLVHAPGGRVVHSIPKREDYLRGQTPQTFRMDWILEAHNAARKEGIQSASDDCSLVLRIGKPLHIVAGDERNIKITSALDLLVAQSCTSFFMDNCNYKRREFVALAQAKQ